MCLFPDAERAASSDVLCFAGSACLLLAACPRLQRCLITHLVPAQELQDIRIGLINGSLPIRFMREDFFPGVVPLGLCTDSGEKKYCPQTDLYLSHNNR